MAKGSVFWGGFFLLWGSYLLAGHYGYIRSSFPFWAIMVLLIGLSVLAKGRL